MIHDFRLEMENIIQTLNLLSHCVNSKMEKRHWEYIHKVLDWKFDYKSNYFNIQNLIAKNFQQYEPQVLHIIDLAGKEDNIQNVIKQCQNVCFKQICSQF